ncbi:MAG: hypothetical protein U9O98_02745, partial [Asgard group archaeon]|nr:hypothetical protein [Asgard group archaeon]
MNKQHLETSVFTTPLEKLKQIFRQARDLSWEHHGQQLEAYYPKPKFPSISITGEKCEQNCLYCNKKYLKGMKAITNPSKLL